MSINTYAAIIGLALLLAPVLGLACQCGGHDKDGKPGYNSSSMSSVGYRAMADNDSEANDNDRDDQYERAEAYGEGVVAGYSGTQGGSMTSGLDAERQADYDRIFGAGDSAANNRWNKDRDWKGDKGANEKDEWNGDRDQAGKPNGDWNWSEGKCHTR